MTDKMREEFEDWFFGELDAGAVVEEACWKAWQAGRAAVVVELPEYEFSNHHRNILIDEVKSSLDAAGVKYE